MDLWQKTTTVWLFGYKLLGQLLCLSINQEGKDVTWWEDSNSHGTLTTVEKFMKSPLQDQAMNCASVAQYAYLKILKM